VAQKFAALDNDRSERRTGHSGFETIDARCHGRCRALGDRSTWPVGRGDAITRADVLRHPVLPGLRIAVGDCLRESPPRASGRRAPSRSHADNSNLCLFTADRNASGLGEGSRFAGDGGLRDCAGDSAD